MGKIKEFYMEEMEKINMIDDYEYFKRKNDEAKSVLEFIFDTEDDEWEAVENYKMEQQYLKFVGDVNNKKCN